MSAPSFVLEASTCNSTSGHTGFNLTDGLREHAERRLRFSLNWARRDVRKVILRLIDINGPRGGSAKRCQLRIPLPRMRDVVIEDASADLYLAVDRAVERAGRTLERRLSRRRKFGPAPPCSIQI